MTDRNNNFTPDGFPKRRHRDARTAARTARSRGKTRSSAPPRRKKQARIEEKKKQADEEKKQAAEARRKAKEKPPLTAEEKAQKAARAKHIKIAAIVFASVFRAPSYPPRPIGGYIVTGSDTNYPERSHKRHRCRRADKGADPAALDEQGWDDIVDKTLVVTLPAKVSFKVDYVTAGMKLSREQAADAAYSYGRTQGLFGNLFRYFLCCALPVDVDALLKKP